jgi:phage-related tail fiber protein
MGVGDGNGNPITPLETMTELVNEVYRIPINTIYVDKLDVGHIIAEMVIPSNEGGWTVREVGLFDVDGNLFAVGSLPESVKPATGEGAGAEITVRMHLVMSAAQADSIEIKIDTTVVLSTRQYVVEKIVTHDEDPAAHGGMIASTITWLKKTRTI